MDKKESLYKRAAEFTEDVKAMLAFNMKLSPEISDEQKKNEFTEKSVMNIIGIWCALNTGRKTMGKLIKVGREASAELAENSKVEYPGNGPKADTIWNAIQYSIPRFGSMIDQSKMSERADAIASVYVTFSFRIEVMTDKERAKDLAEFAQAVTKLVKEDRYGLFEY